MNNAFALGVDIGGSHITAAIVDLSNQTILPGSLQRKAIDSKGSAVQIIEDWSEVIRNSFSSIPGIVKKIGLAMPGPCDYEKGVSFIKGLDKYEAFYGLNIKELLGDALGMESKDIIMKNDAACFLLGEVFGGAAMAGLKVVGVTLGTGLGSAYSKEGNVTDGDLWCTPYKDGTAEDYISARWLVKQYKELTGHLVQNVKELKERESEDANVREVFATFGKNLGEVLVSYVSQHNADTVVVGGNINNAWELFMPAVEQALALRSMNVSIKKAMLGELAALVGAASCWDSKLGIPEERESFISKRLKTKHFDTNHF